MCSQRSPFGQVARIRDGLGFRSSDRPWPVASLRQPNTTTRQAQAREQTERERERQREIERKKREKLQCLDYKARARA